MTMTMKSSLLIAVLLLLSLNDVAESRTWRPHSSLVGGASSRSTFFVRGGSDDGNGVVPPEVVPQVPTTIPHNHIVARGGSTRTVEAPTGALPATIPQPQSPLSGEAVATNNNATEIIQVEAVLDNEPPTKDELKAIKAEEKQRKKLEKKEAKLEKKEAKKELKRHKAIAKKLKNRNATNMRRKVMHACFGFLFAGLNHFIPKDKFVPGMTILTSATLLMELLRYRKGFGWMNEILHFVLGSSLRKHEMDGKFTGSFYYFLGVTITSALYPTSCATLGICQLAIADPTASYFGRKTRHVYWSRIENGLGGFGRNKGILGFLGGALACVPMNYHLLNMAQFATPVSKTSILVASLALGFAGAFADLAVPTPTLTLPKRVCGVRVPPFHVDDNVVVPVAAGFACTKVYAMLHWPANLALAKYLVL